MYLKHQNVFVLEKNITRDWFIILFDITIVNTDALVFKKNFTV